MSVFWDPLINRARELASTQSETAEMLEFYARLLTFQKELHGKLERHREPPLSGALMEDLPVLRPSMSHLLRLAKTHGPAQLAEQSAQLETAGDDETADLLLDYWVSPTDVNFFAKALLQPYTRRLAEIGARPAGRRLQPAENRCPFCDGLPQLSVLKSQEFDSDSGGRSLLCSTCLTTWPFRRVVCAYCREERPSKLAYFHTAQYDHVRVEACDTCRRYTKGIDLTRFGLAVPLVDEVAAAALDVWTRERDYVKIELNLLGL